MAYQVNTTPDFERSTKKIQKKYKSITRDILVLVEQLEKDPCLGVALGNNLYKIRLNISATNKGKSSGARVITYVKVVNTTVLLAEIYLKSDFDTIDETLIIRRLEQQGLL